jgi:hypothetical protein
MPTRRRIAGLGGESGTAQRTPQRSSYGERCQSRVLHTTPDKSRRPRAATAEPVRIDTKHTLATSLLVITSGSQCCPVGGHLLRCCDGLVAVPGGLPGLRKARSRRRCPSSSARVERPVERPPEAPARRGAARRTTQRSAQSRVPAVGLGIGDPGPGPALRPRPARLSTPRVAEWDHRWPSASSADDVASEPGVAEEEIRMVQFRQTEAVSAPSPLTRPRH